jgi:hypothetical protein
MFLKVYLVTEYLFSYFADSIKSYFPYIRYPAIAELMDYKNTSAICTKNH